MSGSAAGVTALAGFLALGTALPGEPELPVLGAAAWIVARAAPPLPAAFATPALLLALATPLLAPGSPTVAAALLLTALQVRGAATRRGPDDARRTALLAFLMLVLGAARTSSPVFLSAALLFAAAAPVALLPPGRPGPRALVAAGVPLVAAMLFPVLPRLTDPAPRAVHPTSALVGFTDEVRLGAVARLLDDPTPVFRARVERADGAVVRGPVYFRGMVLDAFDGRRWSATGSPVRLPPGTVLDRALTLAPSDGYRVRIAREALTEPVLFATGRVLASDLAEIEQDPQGNLFLPGPPRAVAYVLHVIPPLAPDGWPPPEADPPLAIPLDLAPWLALPSDLDPRIPALAARIAGGTTDPWEKVTALRDHLLSDWRYSRRPPEPSDEAPLARFLFAERSGHCEYFASALAVLARAEGIPARLVNGFAGGEFNEVDGTWLFRRYHAHSWVEVRLPGLGWVAVEATPGPGAPVATWTRTERLRDALAVAWRTSFLGFDREAQAGLVLRSARRLERILPGRPQRGTGPWVGVAALALATAGALVTGLRLARGVAAQLAGEASDREPSGRIARLHAKARRVLERRGWTIPQALPPVEAARWLAARGVREGPDLEALAWLLYRVRWGGEREAPLVPEARRLLRRITRGTANGDPRARTGLRAPT